MERNHIYIKLGKGKYYVSRTRGEIGSPEDPFIIEDLDISGNLIGIEMLDYMEVRVNGRVVAVA